MIFLSLEQVHRLHAIGLEDHGGSPGIRDLGLIESALASARNVTLYGGGDAFDVAAAYTFHLAQAQAYIDGNKRVGIMAARLPRHARLPAKTKPCGPRSPVPCHHWHGHT